MKRLASLLIVMIVIQSNGAWGQDEGPMLEPIPVPQPQDQIRSPASNGTAPFRFDSSPTERPSFPNSEIIVDDPAASTEPPLYEIAPPTLQGPVTSQESAIVEYPPANAHVVQVPRYYRGVGATVYRAAPACGLFGHRLRAHRVVAYEVPLAPTVQAPPPYHVNVVPPPIVHVRPRYVPGQPLRNLIRAPALP